jgi:glycosyltransferase involved in cell wall biosynthesis
MKTAVLIPCYNEEITIEKVIKDFRKELPEADIYVYDNNSKDKTAEIAKKNGAIVIHEYRQGKGNVVRSMFRDIDADIYVMVDGDDTYPAEEVHKLIEPVAKGEADMAIGDRLTNGTYQKENKRHFHEFGNNLVKKAINMAFKTNLKDIMTGYRVFNKMFVKTMPVMSPKFEIETEMSLHALDKKFIIKEIPIIYRDRPNGSESKLNTVSDGIKVIKTIVKMFKDFNPRQFFWVFSLLFVLIGLIVGMPVIIEFIKTGFITKVPSAILATGIMIFAIITAQCGVILDTVVKQNREKYELELSRYVQIEKIKSKD